MKDTFTIMVIDDDITLLKSVEDLLTRHGYTVHLAKSGSQAIKAIRKNIIPDLILLDIAMPDMDGYTVYKKVQEIRHIPTIFLTSMEDMSAELEGLKLGAIDYITKPFVDDILLIRLRNHLDTISKLSSSSDKDSISVEFNDDKVSAMKNRLTPSEFNVCLLVSKGYTNQEIADALEYSYSYVKKIIYNLFNKLEIEKRTQIRDFFI